MQLKRFKYSLAGAQRLENYRLDGLTVELAELKQSLQSKMDEHDQLTTAIGEEERALIALIQQQPLFWIERREAVCVQIADQRQRQNELHAEMEQLRQSMTVLIARITESRKSQRLLEKHSDNCRTDFEKKQEKVWEGWLDEIWLSRGKGSG